MCGIIGSLARSYSSNGKIDVRLISHRGPDSTGHWEDENIKLGHTRLSIIDLSPLGHQPMMLSHTDRYCISFNGEIYNYPELRQELIDVGYHFLSRSDTEVLLTAFAHWGKDCLDKLRGMFALAIWDRQEQSLFLARDRMGEKPLYYWYDDTNFYFASELKALVKLLPQTPDLNPVAVDLFLHYQYIPEPLTPLAGVHKLPAAHFLNLDRATWQIEPQRYWSITDIPAVDVDPVTAIRQELERSIDLTLRSDVPVGLALSGGIDSGAIAAIAAPRYKDTLQAFSIGYPGSLEHDERGQARDLAARLGLPFFDVELTTADFVDSFPSLVYMTDDPIADIALYGHYAVMKMASEQQIKVMLTGIGADELFWGYSWTADAARLTEQKQQILQDSFVPPWIWSRLQSSTNSTFYRRLAQTKKIPSGLTSRLVRYMELGAMSLDRPDLAVYMNLNADFREALRHCSQLYTAEFKQLLPIDNPYQPFMVSERDLDDISIGTCRILMDTWLVSNCLALGDRVSMAAGVEARVPFVDYKLVELVIGLRKHRSDRHLPQKYWLKAALRGILPDDVLNRPKRGFQPPCEEWMKGVLQRYLPWLEQGYLIELNIFNGDYLSKLIEAFKSRGKFTFFLYKLVLIEVWYRKIVVE